MPLPRAKAAPHPVGKKETNGRNQPPQHHGLLLWYCTTGITDYRRICRAQSLGIWLWQRNGEGLETTSTWILANWVHTYSVQILIPTSSFMHFQNQVDGALWPVNLAGCRSAWCGSSNKKLCSPRAWFAYTQERSWVTAPPPVESVSQTGAGSNT